MSGHVFPKQSSGSTKKHAEANDPLGKVVVRLLLCDLDMVHSLYFIVGLLPTVQKVLFVSTEPAQGKVAGRTVRV
jgi:hypothetical protein